MAAGLLSETLHPTVNRRSPEPGSPSDNGQCWMLRIQRNALLLTVSIVQYKYQFLTSTFELQRKTWTSQEFDRALPIAYVFEQLRILCNLRTAGKRTL